MHGLADGRPRPPAEPGFTPVADPDGVVAETDESDNSASVTAFGPDLSLEVIGLEYWGYGQVRIESLVRNGGDGGERVRRCCASTAMP